MPVGTEIKIKGDSPIHGTIGESGSISFYVRDEYNQTIPDGDLTSYI
jgi:hypothetical protein